ncbi:MAG TPA: hypothetical protein VL418_18160 [Devosiaceae bacterium]|nr:hypothetical protein [Devosiaceae bacterium]
MDSVNPIDALRAKVEETKEAFDRAASAAFLHDDPAKDQLVAMGLAVEAIFEICEASDRSQRTATATLAAQLSDIAGDASQKLVERTGPQVANVIERATKFQLQTVRRRTLFSGIAGILVAAALVAGVSYIAGFASGQAHGEVVGNTISAAMAAGPNAAAAWVGLMKDNDPVRALSVCKQSVSTDAHGRRYCAMPVWLDPPSVPDGR